MATVREILHGAPHKPGVYMMKNARGRVFYIGKAKDLHNRMHQYITPNSDTRPFVLILDRLLADVEFFLTTSEKEALLLENILIKKHRPQYNVRIKDDTNFFSLRLDLHQDFPRLQVVRKRKKDGALYFGPYSGAGKAREMLRLVNKHFALRDCTERAFQAAKRPCMRYQMGRCKGPCSLPVEAKDYHEEVRRVRMFLEGKKELLVQELEPLMQRASENMEYELAAKYRDQIQAVSGSLEKQVMDLSKDVDWDVIGWLRKGEVAVFTVVKVRLGRMVDRVSQLIDCRALSDTATISGFLSQYYEDVWPLPQRILLPLLPDNHEGVQEWLSERRGTRVNLSLPERGKPARLLGIAMQNAAHAFAEMASKKSAREKVLSRLKQALSLKRSPVRIECYDISNIQGRLAVGSMVCFIEGEAAVREYRRYRIKLTDGPDDFAMMHEVLSRRMERGIKEGNLPDLILVDGGKGQLNMALAVFDELQVKDVELASLAKSRLKESVGEGQIAEEFEGKLRTPERVFRPGIKNPVVLKPGTAELNLLQQLRDEAHRFAITYHRKLRSKQNLRSGLLDIPGIGPKRAQALLRHFGSLKQVKLAKVEDIAAVDGFNRTIAEDILAFLSRS